MPWSSSCCADCSFFARGPYSIHQWRTGVHMIAALTTIKIISPSQPLANGVAFVCSTTFSYFVNTLWSFQPNYMVKILLDTSPLPSLVSA